VPADQAQRLGVRPGPVAVDPHAEDLTVLEPGQDGERVDRLLETILDPDHAICLESPGKVPAPNVR
jgi:hypothetical protein